MQEKIGEQHSFLPLPIRNNSFQENNEDDRSLSASPPPPPPPRINLNLLETKENEMSLTLTHRERNEEHKALTTIFQNHLLLCFSDTKYDEDVLIKKKELLFKLLTKRDSIRYEEDLYRKELLMYLLFYENGVGDFSKVFINAGIKIDEARFKDFVLTKEDLSKNKDPKDFNKIYSQYLEYTQQPQNSPNETEGYESGSDRSDSPPPPPPPRPRNSILQQPIYQSQEESISKQQDFKSSRSNLPTETTETQTKKSSLLDSLKCFSSCCFLVTSNVKQNTQDIQVELGTLQSPRRRITNQITRPSPAEPIIGLSDQQRR